MTKKQQKFEHIVLVALGGFAVAASIGIIINSIVYRGRVDLWLMFAGIILGLLNVRTVVKHGIALYRNREA